MPIKIETTCDSCQKQLEEGNLVYCRDCYSKLEGGLAGCAERVKELEDKIAGLEWDLKTAISKLPD